MKYYSTLSFLKSWNNYSVSEYILTYFTHLYGHLKLIAPKTIFNPKNYRTTLQYITFSNSNYSLYLNQIQVIKELNSIPVSNIHECSQFFLEIYFSCYNKRRVNIFKANLMEQLPPTQENYDFLLEKGNFKFAEFNYVQKNLIVFASPKIPRFFLTR